jgi:hypothetical protein
MTQKHAQVSAYAVLLILGVSTTWAEAKKDEIRELLPAPKCCCNQSDSVVFGCCAETASSPCCVKQAQNLAANCGKQCDIDHWLQAVCPLDLKDAPLSQALDELRSKTGLNIVVDEPALNQAGVSLERHLTLKVDGMPLGNLLRLLLHQAHLAYVIKDKVLLVTTEAQARGEMISRIHPLGNLLSPADPIILPTANGEVFFGWSSPTPAGMRLLEETPEESLIDLIVQSIEPATWCDNGGPGTIDYFPAGKSLIVNQTADVQEQIADLLANLRRCQEDEASVRGPVPFLTMPLPVPPVASLPPCASPPTAASMPQFFAQPVPHPLPFAGSPVPPPCPTLGMMPAPVLCPPPPVQESPAPRAYVLEAKTMQSTADGQERSGPRQRMEFRAAPCFRGQMVMAYKEDKQYRNSLLQVKATTLKNERLHMEVIGVQAKAENTSNGDIVLGLDVTPLLDRQVKPGKTVKKVLERDEAGRPRKWVELTVTEELPQAPGGAVFPPLAAPRIPAAILPMPAMTAPLACQPLPCPVIPPAAAVLQCLAAQPQNEFDQAWRVRSVVLEGKPRLIIRQGDQDSVTLKTLEIKIPGDDPLKLSTAGQQIHARNGSLQAHADAVSRTSRPGCFIFEGHVKLAYKKDGELARVTAERVWVNLADGRFEIQPIADSYPHGSISISRIHGVP